eukprot:TRINITY_DN57372_c0_g1_i1.p1 TRINITY_DN57372_c0_g1~~TRINITY_DN57372_c0_g1_i1.p1  ORF type:complete len:135 (+),score=9.02 TRINITY_DN57372_c0_g1_i1:75-479(+)
MLLLNRIQKNQFLQTEATQMTCPEMSDFSAWINLQMPGPSNLIVIGKVVTDGGDYKPRLCETVPPGINPQILLLDLTIEKTGNGGTEDIAPRDVRFEKPAKQGEFSQVTILFKGEPCRTLDVQEARQGMQEGSK